MESNKEEAQKCILIAKKALSEKNFEKAIKFLQKSHKLYPSDAAESLLKNAENVKSSQNEESKADIKSKSSNQSVPDFSELHGSAQPHSRAYTQAQKDLAQRINKCKDYYEILGVDKKATDSEVKKAYRKMALQLHPDKNLAPGSTEAFKAVGKAFSVLSDPEKRRQYDLYGPESVDASSRRRRRNSSSDYEEEAFDPQDVFNMFFGGGFPSENVRVFRRGNNTYYYNRPGQNQQQENQSGFAAFLRFLPVIIFIFASFVGNFYTTPPVFRLAKRGEYVNPRETANLKVQYYVKNDFNQQYRKGTSARHRIEDEVEAEYISHLRNSCYQERVDKENVRRQGIYFGNSNMVKRAGKMTTPSCERLEELFQRG